MGFAFGNFLKDLSCAWTVSVYGCLSVLCLVAALLVYMPIELYHRIVATLTCKFVTQPEDMSPTPNDFGLHPRISLTEADEE